MKPSLDSLTSHFNKTDNYVSWHSKAGAVLVDPSSLSWNDSYFYISSPLLVSRDLSKHFWRPVNGTYTKNTGNIEIHHA